VDTVQGIADRVVEEVVAFLAPQPLNKRLEHIPTPSRLDMETLLRDLHIDYRDRTVLGIRLTQHGHCIALPVQVTAHWRTIGDIVETVIRFGPPTS
jgi:hypothetical protein